jgi:hypothetical protein
MRSRAVPLLLCVGLPLVVLLAATPLYNVVPARDSGLFLYIGQAIQHGQVPYRDVWDHKPPGVFYIDAVGLWLGGRWGVWGLELVNLVLAAALGFAVLADALGFAAALPATCAWLTAFPLLLDGGNFTEEYALVLQFAALALFWWATVRGRAGWAAAGIGGCAALLFLEKQTAVGVPLAIALYWLGAGPGGWGGRLRRIAAMVGGGAVVLAGAVAYFAAQGALPAALDAIFRYNLFYVQLPLTFRLVAVGLGLFFLALPAVALPVLVRWVVVLRRLVPPAVIPLRARPLLAVTLIGVPVELLLVVLAGRVYSHYYITWLPVFALVMAFSLYKLGAGARRRDPAAPEERAAWAMVYVLAAGLVLVVGGGLALRGSSEAGAPTRAAAVTYLAHDSAPGEPVLLWGAEAGVNFVAGHPAPTRFVYQYPLFTQGYGTPAIVDEFVRDLAAHPPRWIFDTSPTDGFVPPLDAPARAAWVPLVPVYGVSPALEPVFSFVATHYQPVGQLGPAGWRVYQYIGGATP